MLHKSKYKILLHDINASASMIFLIQSIHFSRGIMAISNLTVYDTLKTEGIRVVYVTYCCFIFSHWDIKSKNMFT